MWTANIWIIFVALFTSMVTSTCIPEVPSKLLAEPILLTHPAVTSAFRAVQKSLDELFVNTTRDALSFAIVSRIECIQVSANI